MRLRLGDAWRLGWANLAGHKARSVLTILTVSILFGLILGLNLVLQGLEKTILTASVEETAGKVYLKVEFDTGMSAKTMTDVELLDLGWVKKAEIIEAEAKTFGGKKAGTLTTLWGEQRVQIMSLEPGFQEVGEFSAIPGGQLELEGFNFLNWPLSGIYVISSLGSMVMIDDDLESTEDYLRKWIEERYRKAEENYVGMIAAEPDMNEEERRETYEYLRGGALKATRAMIIEFENTEDAVRYGLQEREGEMRHMAINDLFSNTVDAARSFASDEKSILILEIILLVVAVVIAAMTFGHLVDQEAATVALYRAMGATRGEVIWIYFCYLVQLCLMALWVCILIALGMAGVTTLMSAGELGVRLQEFYGLAEVPKVSFCAMNWLSWVTVGMVLLVAPLSLGLAGRHFSASNVARKLKEE